MAKMVLLVALCVVLPMALVSAGRPVADPYSVEGRVYCDTCRAGFETPLSEYIAGAKVRLECRSRHSMKMVYSTEGVTDDKGCYKLSVPEDQGDHLCDTFLVSSPRPTCALPDPGRDRSRVILTDNNGMVSKQRFANALGYVQEYHSAGCTEVLQQYQLNDEDLS